MTQRDDVMSDGGDAAKLYASLVGNDQDWLRLCREAAGGHADAVRRLQSEGTPEKLALRDLGRPMPSRGDLLEEAVTSFDATTATAIGHLALAAAGAADGGAAAAHLLAHCEVAGLVSVGMRSAFDEGRTPNQEPAPSDMLAALLAVADSPARGFATVLLDELMAAGARTVTHVTVPVLFGGDQARGR